MPSTITARLFCLFLFLLGSFVGQSETRPASHGDNSLEGEWSSSSTVEPNAHQPGFFKRLKLANQLRQGMKKDEKKGEHASPMAWTALCLFIFGALCSLPLAGTLPTLATLAAIALLVSIIMALFLLFGKGNRKTKAFAKTILIGTGILLVLAILLFVIVFIAVFL